MREVAAGEDTEEHQQECTVYILQSFQCPCVYGTNGDMAENCNFGQKTPPGGKNAGNLISSR